MQLSVTDNVRELLYLRDAVFSFEFFPPKTLKGNELLSEAISELSQLHPAFVSVTCGAGGSTRDLTGDIVVDLQKRYNFGVMAHITATGYSRSELQDLIHHYYSRGIKSFLALRGDPPKGDTAWQAKPDQLNTAAEVVKLIRQSFSDVSIGVACYPEVHPDAPDLETDLHYFKEKVFSGADFAITQMFFNNDSYFNFSSQARRLGIKIPILPGIMPITQASQLSRFQDLCGVSIPASLSAALNSCGTNHESEVGLAYAAAQCTDLLRRGAPGIHFFTLNQSRTCHILLAILKSMGWG